LTLVAHAWFEPLWRRLGTIAVCLLWLAIEVLGEPGSFWFWVALGVTAWAIYDLFLSGKYGRNASGTEGG
jgi:hypothetical protein